MARRASSGVNTKALLIGAAVLVLVLGAAFVLLNRSPSGFDAPEIDMEQVLSNSRSLSGNQYQVTGTLVERRIESYGQVVFLNVGGEASTAPLAIKIPDGFKGGNLNQQSDYTFLIEFDTEGVAVASDVKQL